MGYAQKIGLNPLYSKLFKTGTVNDPGNYRGISLCDTSSKLHSSIINRRLQELVEQNNITGEYQDGSKRGYSTVDHMFTLLAVYKQKQKLTANCVYHLLTSQMRSVLSQELCSGLYFNKMVLRQNYTAVLKVCTTM